MRSLAEYAGAVGVGVSSLVVLIAVVLLVLLIGCVALGAFESYSNPPATADSAKEYANLQSNISSAQAGITRAADNTTGR
jgi:flagellar basal body-associated protein FliL